MQSQPDPSEFNYMQTLRGASEASSNLGDAIFHHGDAIQHLSEALEDEVAVYARELGTRVAMLHDAAGQISTAGQTLSCVHNAGMAICTRLAWRPARGWRAILLQVQP